MAKRQQKKSRSLPKPAPAASESTSREQIPSEHSPGRLLLRERTAGRRFDIYDDETSREVYVDGLGAVISGPVITRLSFYTMLGHEFEPDSPEPIERRKVVTRLVIPTIVLAEMLQNLTAGLAANRATLLEGAERHVQALGQQLPDLIAPGDE